MKSILALCSFLLGRALLAVVPYYRDNDATTAGFGAAACIWAAPTTGDITQGWSTSATGDLLPGNITTGTSDGVHFGTALMTSAANIRHQDSDDGLVTISGTHPTTVGMGFNWISKSKCVGSLGINNSLFSRLRADPWAPSGVSRGKKIAGGSPREISWMNSDAIV